MITAKQIKELKALDIVKLRNGWCLVSDLSEIKIYYNSKLAALVHLTKSGNHIFYDLISNGNSHYNENYRCRSEFDKSFNNIV